jgi:transcriptional regulator with XRE-family HTH domain
MTPLPRLRELRQRAFLTQKALADMTGVSSATINRIELGRQPARYVTARKLALALGVSPGELAASSSNGVEES